MHTRVQIPEGRGVQNFNFPGLESDGIRPGCWKVMENKPNGRCSLDPCTCFRPLRTLSLSTVNVAWWLGGLVAQWLGRWLVIERLRVRLPAGQLPSNNSGHGKSDLFDNRSIKQFWKDMESAHKRVLECCGKPLSVFSVHAVICVYCHMCILAVQGT